MATKVKFCGLKTTEAVRLAAELGAWKIGFIFFPKSPRHVGLEEAIELGRLARDIGLETTAVTVDATPDDLADIVSAVRPDLLQFHGAETPDHVAAMKARFGLAAMKAFSIRDATDLDAVDAWRDVADYVLFDAKAPKGSELPGGNGVSFDWSLLGGLPAELDYVLSGGLTVENIGQALSETGARFVDVSSGIESAPGIKDPAKMRAFAASVRRHDQSAAMTRESVA
jgi:phosphoribosylanthranilate isomerase